MAGEVQESLWRLNADVSDAVAALRTIIGEFQALNTTVDRIDRALDDVNGHLDKAGQAHERFGSRVGLANQALVQFAATMTGTLAGLAGFAILREVQQGLEGLVGGVVKTNAQFESWRVTMGAIIDGMGRTSDAERDLARRSEEASAQFSTKWREAEEKRQDAAEKYARRREELERQLGELDGRAAAEHQRKFVQAEAERDHAHSQTILHLQQREDDLNTQFADRVQSQVERWQDAQARIDDKHRETVTNIERAQADLARDYQDKVDDRQARWALHLREMEAGHARTVRALEEQISDLTRDTADKLADLDQTYANRRQDAAQRFIDRQTDLQQRLRQARTPEQRRSVQEQLRDLERGRAEEEARLNREEAQARARIERESQQRLELLQRRIRDENAKYEEQRRFQEEQHQLEVRAAERAYNESQAKLRERVDDAERQYERETAAAEKARDAAIAAADEQHQQAVAALHAQIDEMEQEYERGKTLRAQAEQEALDRLAASEDKRRQELQRQLANLADDYAKTLRDLGEQADELAQKQADAVQQATEAPQRATSLALFEDPSRWTEAQRQIMATLDATGDDADKAAARLDILEDHLLKLGERTPFTIDRLLKTAQNLITTGLDPTRLVQVIDKDGQQIDREFLDIVADWEAAMKGFGPGAQEAIENFFRFVQGGRFGEAMENLRQLGINPKDLEEFGVRFNKAGQIVEGQGKVIDAALQLIQKQFGGVAEKQSKTFAGIISNLQDYGLRLARFAGEPFFTALRDAVADLYDTIQGSPELTESLTQIGRALGTVLGDAIRNLVSVVRDALPVFTGLVDWGDDLSPLQQTLLRFRDAFRAVADFLQTHGEQIKSVLLGIGIVVGGLLGAAALGGLAAFLAANGPLLLAIAAVSAALELFRRAWESNWGDIQGKVGAVVDFLRGHVEIIKGLLVVLGGPIAVFAALVITHWDDILAATQAVVQFIVDGFTSWGFVFDQVGTRVRRFTDDVGAFFDRLGTRAHALIQSIGDFFAGLGELIAAALAGPQGASDAITAWLNSTAAAFGRWWEDTRAAWGRFFETFGRELHDYLLGDQGVLRPWTDWLGEVAGAIGRWWDETTGFWGQLFSDLGTLVHDGLVGDDGVLTRWGEGLGALGDALTGWAGDRLKEIGAFLGSVASTVGEAFAEAGAIVRAWLDGLGALRDWLIARLWGDPDSLVAQVSAFLALVADTLRGAFAAGGSILAGWVEGLGALKDQLVSFLWGDEQNSLVAQFGQLATKAADAVRAAATTLATNFVGALKDALQQNPIFKIIADAFNAASGGGSEQGGGGGGEGEGGGEEGALRAWTLLGRKAGEATGAGYAQGVQASAQNVLQVAQQVFGAIGQGFGFGLGQPYPGGISAGGPPPAYNPFQVGSQAYPGGGLEYLAGLFGAEGPFGPNASPPQNRLNAMEAFRTGAYPGSGLAAWHLQAPGLTLAQIYQNTPPGMNPFAQPTTSSLFQRFVGPATAGPQGENGPSYSPDYALLARAGGLANAILQLGLLTPEMRAAGVTEDQFSNTQYTAEHPFVGDGALDVNGTWVPARFMRTWPVPFPPGTPLPMAAGGIVTRATAIVAGEAGREAILPLPSDGLLVRIAGFTAAALAMLRDALRPLGEGGSSIVPLAGPPLAGADLGGATPPVPQPYGGGAGVVRAPAPLATLPYLADGGVIASPTTFVAGELGHEAILPLPPGGPLVQIGRFADAALLDWYNRFVPVWLDLLQTKVTDALTLARTTLKDAIDATTKATRDLLPLVVPFSGASSALAALMPSQQAMTSATQGMATTLTNMATQMHTDLVGVQQAQQAQSLGEKLDVLHTDLGSLLSGQSGGTTTLGAKLDTLHGDLGTTLHADLGAVVTALVGSGAGDNLADLLVALGDVTASVRDTLHGDLGAVTGATQSVRSEVTALGTLLHGDLGTQSSTLSGLRADITALGLLVARTNTLLGDSDFSAVGSRGINYLTFGLVGQNDQKFYPAHFAEGGLVTGALHALVGEAGPELIVPLDRVERLFDSLGAAHGAAPAARPAITAVYAPTVREEVSEGTFDELIWSLDQKYRGRF